MREILDSGSAESSSSLFMIGSLVLAPLALGFESALVEGLKSALGLEHDMR
jgi:hypothetical protein